MHKISVPQNISKFTLYSMLFGTNLPLLKISAVNFRVGYVLILAFFFSLIALKYRLAIKDKNLYLLATFHLALLLNVFFAEFPVLHLKQYFLIALFSMLYIQLLISYQCCGLNNKSVTRIITVSAYLISAISFSYAAYSLYTSNNVFLAWGNFKGTFAERNELATFVVYLIGFMIPLVLYKSNENYFGHTLAFFLLFSTLLFNMSRGSIVAFVFQFILTTMLFYLNNIKFNITKNLRIIILLLVILSLMFFTALKKYDFEKFSAIFWGRIFVFGTSKDATGIIRLNTIQDTLNIFIEKSVTGFSGFGLGNIGYYLQSYTNQNVSRYALLPKFELATSSNIINDTLFETGGSGIISLFLLASLPSFNLVRKLKHQNGDDKLFSIGALCSFWGLVISGLSYNTFYIIFFWSALAFISISSQNFGEN